jgi:hypothetical protein
MHSIVVGAILMSSLVSAQEVATVADVSGKRVRLRLAQNCVPAVGDTLELRGSVPGFDEPVPVQGTWKVLQVSAGIADAEAVEASAGAPQVGNTALIRCAAPPTSPLEPPPAPAPAAPRGAAAPGSLTPAVPMQGIAGGNLVVPGPIAPSFAAAPPSTPPPPAFTAAFEIRHAHPAFRRTSFATATLTLSKDLWMYAEAGENAVSDHTYGFFCKDFKEAKQSKLNRGELSTLEGLAMRQPAKLTINAGRTLKQLVAEQEIATAIVRALDQYCRPSRK